MNHAITALQVALATAENNEPIHRAEGNTKQADLCKESIQDFTYALALLERQKLADDHVQASQRLDALRDSRGLGGGW